MHAFVFVRVLSIFPGLQKNGISKEKREHYSELRLYYSHRVIVQIRVLCPFSLNFKAVADLWGRPRHILPPPPPTHPVVQMFSICLDFLGKIQVCRLCVRMLELTEPILLLVQLGLCE